MKKVNSHCFSGAGPWVRKYVNPSERENLVLVTVRPYGRTYTHLSMYANVTNIT